MMIFMVMLNPIKALFNVHNEFKRYEGTDERDEIASSNNNDGNASDSNLSVTKSQRNNLLLPKLLFVGINLVCVAIGVWKFNSLGLLPTSSHVPPTLSAPNVK